MIEIWKDVEGFEDCYQISNLGRVKSLSRKGSPTERILSPSKTRGYFQVSLKNKSQKKSIAIHLLVWDAFGDGNRNGYHVDHIDECKTNNMITNLQLLTPIENMNKSMDKLLEGLKKRDKKRREENKKKAKIPKAIFIDEEILNKINKKRLEESPIPSFSAFVHGILKEFVQKKY